MNTSVYISPNEMQVFIDQKGVISDACRGIDPHHDPRKSNPAYNSWGAIIQCCVSFMVCHAVANKPSPDTNRAIRQDSFPLVSPPAIIMPTKPPVSLWRFYRLPCLLLSTEFRDTASRLPLSQSRIFFSLLSPFLSSPLNSLCVFLLRVAITCWPALYLDFTTMKARAKFVDKGHVLCSQLPHAEAIDLSTFPVRKMGKR